MWWWPRTARPSAPMAHCGKLRRLYCALRQRRLRASAVAGLSPTCIDVDLMNCGLGVVDPGVYEHLRHVQQYRPPAIATLGISQEAALQYLLSMTSVDSTYLVSDSACDSALQCLPASVRSVNLTGGGGWHPSSVTGAGLARLQQLTALVLSGFDRRSLRLQGMPAMPSVASLGMSRCDDLAPELMAHMPSLQQAHVHVRSGQEGGGAPMGRLAPVLLTLAHLRQLTLTWDMFLPSPDRYGHRAGTVAPVVTEPGLPAWMNQLASCPALERLDLEYMPEELLQLLQPILTSAGFTVQSPCGPRARYGGNEKMSFVRTVGRGQ